MESQPMSGKLHLSNPRFGNRELGSILLGGAVAATVLLAATTGRGLPAKNGCTDGLKDAEEREQSGRLLEARQLLLTCARTACGRGLSQECRARFVRLDSFDIPSIVPHVADSMGASLADVDVRMDGELLTTHLDGQPLAVDPGLHEFSFATNRGLYGAQKILVAEGEHGRSLTISLHPGRDNHRGAAASQAALSVAPAALGTPNAPAPGPQGPKSASPKGACEAASAAAEEDERSGRLREARKWLLGCAKATCGRALSESCTARFTRLDATDIPSIVPMVTGGKGGRGGRLVEVEVKMDGELLATHLDAQEIAVDPGLHEFSFRAGNSLVTESVMIAQGERNRRLSVSLGARREVAPGALASRASP
jgi:hypothetical protein